MADSPRDELGAEMSSNERAARTGFAQGRVVWFGGPDMWVEDLLFYFQNEHTVLSMWRGHALHPFDRFDRRCYFACVVCFSLFMSAYVQNSHPESEDRVMYGFWLLFSSVLLVVYDYGLRFIATSPCMQHGGSLYGCLPCCRDCCIDCGRQGLYVCVIGSLGFLIAAIVLAMHAEDISPSKFFLTFVVMKALSFMAETCPKGFTFYRNRNKQRQYWQDGNVGGPYPLGPSVPDATYLRESRHDGNIQKWPDRSRHRAKSLERDSPSENSARRAKKVEMLQRARDQVRAQQAGTADAIESLGSRRNIV